MAGDPPPGSGPVLGNIGTLRYRGDAHTVPLCGARAIDLNRHLKSLRNKRKKHRKSSAKRAREKDRCRKKVNT